MANDVIIQAQSTAFERRGTTLQQKAYALPSGLAPIIGALCTNSAPSTTLLGNEQSLLSLLLSQDSQLIPGGLTLKTIQALIAETFEGSGELQALYRLNPFSTDYENNTRALYERQYLIARSTAQSGPQNVRGAQDRQGFELAELDTQMAINRFKEIWANQLAVAQIVIGAVQLANRIAEERRTSQLKAQEQQAQTEQGRVVQSLTASERVASIRNDHIRANAAAGEFLGFGQMLSQEQLLGQGAQGSIQTGFGISYWR